MQDTDKNPIKNNDQKKKVAKSSIWNIDNDELEKQVSQYYQLKLHQSYRGISTIILSLGLICSTLLQFALSTPLVALSIEAAIATTLICFIYRGHRWAMAVFILLFTANLLFSSFERMVEGTFSTSSAIILGGVWIVAVSSIMKAIRIENYRRQYNQTGVVKNQSPHNSTPHTALSEKSAINTTSSPTSQLSSTPKYLIVGLCGLALIIGVALFWWYEIRPAEIKRECSWVEEKYKVGGKDEYRWVAASKSRYELCLRHNGL